MKGDLSQKRHSIGIIRFIGYIRSLRRVLFVLSGILAHYVGYYSFYRVYSLIMLDTIRFIGCTRSLHRILFVLSGFLVHYVGCTHSLCRILLRRVYSFIIYTSVKYAPHSAFDSAPIQPSIQTNDRIAPRREHIIIFISCSFIKQFQYKNTVFSGAVHWNFVKSCVA